MVYFYQTLVVYSKNSSLISDQEAGGRGEVGCSISLLGTAQALPDAVGCPLISKTQP